MKHSDQFFAIPKASSPGCIQVYNREITGKQPDIKPLIQAHTKAVTDFSFVNSDRLLTCGWESVIKLWKLDLEMKTDMIDPIASFSGHKGKVDLLVTHPFAEVFASGGK